MVILLAEDVVASGLCGVMEKALIAQGVSPAVAAVLSKRACHPVVEAGTRRVRTEIDEVKTKAKRKVGKYQKRLGVELKKLKRKHPRTPVARLMKRAHSLTKKAMK